MYRGGCRAEKVNIYFWHQDLRCIVKKCEPINKLISSLWWTSFKTSFTNKTGSLVISFTTNLNNERSYTGDCAAKIVQSHWLDWLEFVYILNWEKGYLAECEHYDIVKIYIWLKFKNPQRKGFRRFSTKLKGHEWLMETDSLENLSGRLSNCHHSIIHFGRK